MVNKILDATTRQLGLNFGSGYKYYVEAVKQNLSKPCFTIDVLEPRTRSRSALLYDRVIPMVIHYFNDAQDTVKKDSYAIAEQIHEALEYLPIEDTFLRGENISWQIIEDDVLQFFITYSFIARKENAMDIPEMESVEHHRQIK